MALCLQDPDVLVRRHALILIMKLILQEFLKWRGLLLFRLLATTLDADAEMSELAKYSIKKSLAVKYADLLVQQFCEVVIVFNSCAEHPSYQAIAAVGADEDVFVSMRGIDLHGAGNRHRRMELYEYCLTDISDEQKVIVVSE